MSLAGEGAVAIWHDIAPEGREDFYAWHGEEHMPERVGIPGFLRGRRYVAIEAGLKSRTQAIADRGFDAAAVDAEIAGDHRREDSMGLLFGREPVPPAVPNATPAATPEPSN